MRKFDPWLRSMVVQMKVQRVGNICSNAYVEPMDATEQELDCEKTYMYAVLTKFLKQVMVCNWLPGL